MPAVRAVLFDGGNTLLELDYPWLADLARGLGATATAEKVGAASASLLRRSSLRYGKTPAPADAAAVFQGSFHAIGEALGLTPATAEAFALAAYREDERDPRGLWRCPAPHALSVLAALAARGLRLGVISNSDGHVEHHLNLADLRGFFGAPG